MSLHLDTNPPHLVTICVHKTRYSRLHAKRIASVMRKRMALGLCAYPPAGYRLHAYKCPVCDCWHIGNTKEAL